MDSVHLRFTRQQEIKTPSRPDLKNAAPSARHLSIPVKIIAGQFRRGRYEYLVKWIERSHLGTDPQPDQVQRPDKVLRTGRPDPQKFYRGAAQTFKRPPRVVSGDRQDTLSDRCAERPTAATATSTAAAGHSEAESPAAHSLPVRLLARGVRTAASGEASPSPPTRVGAESLLNVATDLASLA